MSDISNQLIKDSYNYVLQSDLSSGTVYRIGGSIPVNPKFLSGLTVNSGFTYSNGTEQNGYALLTDGTGYAYWGAISAATPSSGVTSVTGTNGISVSPTTGNVVVSFTGSTTGDYLPLSGGTVTGGTIFQSGLTANTFYSSGQVGVGTASPNAKAIIEIASTTQGVLFPRMTKVQRDTITSPPIGLILFVTDDNEGLYIYKTSGWVQII
jgi:hypothetical protein